MRSLNSPYVPRIAGTGDVSSKPYIAMEHLEGVSLDKIIEEEGGRIDDIEKIIEIVSNIATAVGTLHAQDVIHLDIKPENILMMNDVPKITDLGLAQVMRTSGVYGKTGTPFY
jgi:serine/threonine protein kinase